MITAENYTSPSVEVSSDVEAQKDANLVALWVRELGLALTREKSFRKTGREVVAMYESEKEDKHQFNILFSNTETLAPALYNTTPRPVVQRRFKDEDVLGKYASEATQRVLEFLIDPGEAEYSPFDELMQAAVLEALLPGRGVTWFKYEPTWSEPAEGEAAEVENETVCGEEVPWERFRHGYGKKWPQVPWVAREHLLTQEEVKERWKDLAGELTYTEAVEAGEDGEGSGSALGGQGDSTKGTKLAQIFEIWDKASKQVLFIAPAYAKAPLDVLDDPLDLEGFFPCPRPLMFIRKVSSLTPVALYKTYQEQAKELNTITYRINKVVGAMKVRGLYDATVQGLAEVLAAGDNVLLPADNVAAMIANGMTLEKSIWLVPISDLVAVLQQLYLAREQAKTVIFEISGLADIMRGSSQASETLGAQEIKNQWGTLRLKRSQREVQRYVREALRIMAEIAIGKFSASTLSSMTGLPWPTQAQKTDAQSLAQQMQQVGMPVPEETQAVVMAATTWDEIQALLRDEMSRAYRIDIETNSTVDAEATEDKQNITELVNAMGQFLNGVGPLIETGTMPFDVAKMMLLTIVRRFRFGPEMEDSLKAMAPPKPAADPNAGKIQAEQQKAQLEGQKSQQQMAHDQQRFEMDKMKFQAEQAAGQQDAALQLQIKQEELQLKREEMQLKREELVLKRQFSQEEHKQKLETLAATTQSTITKAKAAAIPKPPAPAPAGAKPPPAPDPVAMIKPLLAALETGLADMGKQIAQGMVEASKTPRTAKKNTDGSWSTK